MYSMLWSRSSSFSICSVLAAAPSPSTWPRSSAHLQRSYLYTFTHRQNGTAAGCRPSLSIYITRNYGGVITDAGVPPKTARGRATLNATIHHTGTMEAECSNGGDNGIPRLQSPRGMLRRSAVRRSCASTYNRAMNEKDELPIRATRPGLPAPNQHPDEAVLSPWADARSSLPYTPEVFLGSTSRRLPRTRQE